MRAPRTVSVSLPTPAARRPAGRRRDRLGFGAAAALTAAVLLAFAACGHSDAVCDDASCTAPPPPRCLGSSLVSYAATGLCVVDACRYEADTTPCPAGCVETRGTVDGSDVVVDAECAPGEGS